MPGTSSSRSDEYDDLRTKWDEMLTGGYAYSPTDPDFSRIITRITAAARGNWDTMNKASGRTYLWADLQGTADSAAVTEAYTRLTAMALAYRTYGSALAGNAMLRADTISALDWMNTNRYNQGTAPYGNWWHWAIGAPLQLNNATVLLYDALTAQQRTNYMAAVDRFSRTVDGTGANRVWKATVVGVRGVIVKNSAKIVNARDGLSGVLGYVTSSDGFYTDGSFIQHSRHPYTGGYGASLLQDIADLVRLLDGSTWRVTDPQLGNIFRWVYDSFEPLIYKGAMMDMSLGRVISRPNSQGHVIGHQVVRAVIRLSQVAPAADAPAFQRMAKEWIKADSALDYYSGASMNMAVLAKAIVGDGNIACRGELTRDVQFNNMARAVHFRPGYAFGISMQSSRIYNYESINNENLRGWHTADGMTYLYNGDLTQFGDAFWPTVDSGRLPGTTVEKNTTVPHSRTSDQQWVGGTELLGYGTTGMALHTPGQTLVGYKSWFMFDNVIVALGAGITATDGKAVETVVENRKISNKGDDTLTVDGTPQPNSIPWSASMKGIRWAHLAGSTPGSDIGYFFPFVPGSSSVVVGLREARTDSWTSINNNFLVDPTPHTRNFLSLALDHGTDPSGAGYAYALLPNMTATQVQDYANHPGFTVLRNDAEGQGVREDNRHVTGANVWVDGGVQVGDIWSNRKSAVMMKEAGGAVDISVTDPTFTGSGTFTVEIAKAGGAVISKDPAIAVTQFVPSIRLAVDAANLGSRRIAKVSLAAPTLYSRAGWSGVYSLGVANTGTRTIEFDATPAAPRVLGVIGFADAETTVDAFSLMNMVVRIMTPGRFDVMDGDSFHASARAPCSAGRKYHVRVVADPAAEMYSVYITPPGGHEMQVAGNYAFQARARAIDNIGKIVLVTAGDGDLTVDNCTIY